MIIKEVSDKMDYVVNVNYEELNDMSLYIPITNAPNANELWRGIGGHFYSFNQILWEFGIF